MPFDLVLNPATVKVPQVRTIEKWWGNVPDVTVRKYMAREHQYLLLHEAVLSSIHYTYPNWMKQKPPKMEPLDYTLRAGFVKAAVLIYASLCEAALRAHAEKRGYTLPANARHRTFGKVIAAWNGQPEVATVWTDLGDLRDMRNNIHLFVAAGNPKADYKNIIAQEATMLGTANTVLGELMKITSP
ncbi:MAG: hypothetical protein U0939_14805 [Pirellulales bacterium]